MNRVLIVSSNQLGTVEPMVVKVFVQKCSYTWSRLIKTKYLWDLPQKIVWQLNKDRKSLELYNDIVVVAAGWDHV